jgi:hypothetical protein
LLFAEDQSITFDSHPRPINPINPKRSSDESNRVLRRSDVDCHRRRNGGDYRDNP